MDAVSSRRRFMLGASALLVGVGACRRKSDKLVVGFSQMDNGGAWRLAETNSMRAETIRRSRYELVVTDAQDQTAKQISDVEDLIARRVKALFVAPREYEGLDPVFEAARHAKIPVFLIDREAAGVPGEDYVSFLASDFVEQGQRAARWLLERTGGRASIVELTGTAGSSVAADRGKGFREGIAGHAEARIIASQTGQFARAVAMTVTQNLIQALGRRITAVYAHSDEMALGAIQALRAAGIRPGEDVTLVSIDGENVALQSILRGELGATVESNPRFGPLAFDALERWLAGEPVPVRLKMEDHLFDANNARAFVELAY
jgi:galactofuranose transport system substrate-binding protein